MSDYIETAVWNNSQRKKKSPLTANTITGKPSSFHCGPEIQQMKLHNEWEKQIKSPNCQKADTLAVYNSSRGVEPGTTWLEYSWKSTRDWTREQQILSPKT